MSAPLLDREKRYRVDGHDGIAFYFHKNETQPDEDSFWSGYEPETGMVVMVMVGDDREWVVDPDDCVALADGEYCAGCGQIGCTADQLGS